MQRRRRPRQRAIRGHGRDLRQVPQGEGRRQRVGPDLSEIGTKLSKEALYLSILDPSAGVSFNYETWLVRDANGTILTGVLVSQTDTEVELKTAEAIVHKLKKDDIEQMKKSPLSLMPADLQKQLKAQDLVDIVETWQRSRRSIERRKHRDICSCPGLISSRSRTSDSWDAGRETLDNYTKGIPIASSNCRGHDECRGVGPAVRNRRLGVNRCSIAVAGATGD